MNAWITLDDGSTDRGFGHKTHVHLQCGWGVRDRVADCLWESPNKYIRLCRLHAWLMNVLQLNRNKTNPRFHAPTTLRPPPDCPKSSKQGKPPRVHSTTTLGKRALKLTRGKLHIYTYIHTCPQMAWGGLISYYHLPVHRQLKLKRGNINNNTKRRLHDPVTRLVAAVPL